MRGIRVMMAIAADSVEHMCLMREVVLTSISLVFASFAVMGRLANLKFLLFQFAILKHHDCLPVHIAVYIRLADKLVVLAT